jgi:hypothetical protein
MIGAIKNNNSINYSCDNIFKTQIKSTDRAVNTIDSDRFYIEQTVDKIVNEKRLNNNDQPCHVTQYNLVTNNVANAGMPLRNNMIQDKLKPVREMSRPRKVSILPYSFTMMKKNMSTTRNNKRIEIDFRTIEKEEVREIPPLRLDRPRVKKGNMFLPSISDRLKIYPPRYVREGGNKINCIMKVEKV